MNCIMNIAIRADGGQSIGMGHIMRCLSLASEFRNNGCNVYFISKYEEGIKKILSNNFKFIPLKCTRNSSANGFYYGDETELVNEAKDIIKIIKDYEIDLLFIDSYNVSENYLISIKSNVKKLAYIDDVNKFIYPVDILINGNISAEKMNYKKYYEDEIMLLGAKYNLIRSEFKDLPERKIKKEVEEVMITTGGSDPHNITIKLLDIFLNDDVLKSLTYNVVVGTGFTNKKEIRELANQYENVVIYENPNKISEIMLESDIAISSGGSTLYELCACGIPTLAFIYADNQRFIVEEMNRLGYIKNIGWYESLVENQVISNVKELIFAYGKRVKMSKLGKKLVDGKGTKRIFGEVRMDNQRR